ncbi:MAG: hypothetical protein IKT41_05490 [Clostridia bacterium]|nr:hypothetical protein [Clostridia bacterium]
MFKRRYVNLGSEKVTEKLEKFLFNEAWHVALTPMELYCMRYTLSDCKLDINNPIIRRIGLNDIKSAFSSASIILHSQKGVLGKTISNFINIFCTLNQRMIFIIEDKDTNYVREICVYLPNELDSMLFIKNSYLVSDITGVVDDAKEFITELSNPYNNLIKYHVQNDTFILNEELDYEKEFLTVTNSNINGSTITFHYIP